MPQPYWLSENSCQWQHNKSHSIHNKSLVYITLFFIMKQVQVQVLFVTYTTIQRLYNQQWNVSQVRSMDSANIVEYNTRETNHECVLAELCELAFKRVVDCFFSRLDCVYGVQSSMCSCLFFLKTHYFSHNLPLFHTSLSLLWQTPRFISWFYEAPPSEYAMGWDWLAGSVCCDWLNRL